MRHYLAVLATGIGLSLAVPATAQLDASEHALATVLADERRDDDRARDAARHPAETLAFFQVEPDHTVAEYSPGGGWYTRVIAPYVAQHGTYIGISPGPGGKIPERYGERSKAFPTTFPQSVEKMTGIPASSVAAYLTTDAPESAHGTVDRILVFRMLHNLVRWGVADTEIMAMRDLLKDDGLVGIVQHEAPEGMPYSKTDGNRGYLQKSDVIALMELYGFELVAESFINANPKDTADHARGVWTLPPSLALGETDKDKYTAIGESNRMTLLFRKAD